MVTTYALYDVVGEQYLSWKHVSYKSAKGFLADYVNEHNAAILKVEGTTVIGEVRKDYCRLLHPQRIDIVVAQKRYLPMK